MRFIALLVAAVIAVVAAVAVLKMSSPSSPTAQTQATNQAPSISTIEILVAREAIDIGSVLEEIMIDRQPWPSHLLLDGFITAGSDDSNLVGKVARANFQKGEPITRNRIANPNDPSFLAANLPKGMRAVTMATDAISGVAGYVFPGDRVDVILTHNIPGDIAAQNSTTYRNTNKPDVSEILVSDARVLAVNVRQISARESASSTPSSITLEVKEVDAQSLRLGEKVGSLSLALRPLKDGDEEKLEPTKSISLTNIKVFGPQNTGGVRVIRGVGDDAATQPAQAYGGETRAVEKETSTNDFRAQ